MKNYNPNTHQFRFSRDGIVTTHRYTWVWLIVLALMFLVTFARSVAAQRVSGSGNITLHNDPARDIAWAQFDSQEDRTVEIRLMSGQIIVTGVEGDTVRAFARDLDRDAAAAVPERSADPRAQGLRKITNAQTGLSLWTDRNIVEVTTRQVGNIYLQVDVPRNADVVVTSQFADSVLVRNATGRVKVRSAGSVRIESVEGEIEAQTSSGWIFLDRVKGSVVANSSFGGIEASLLAIEPEKPVSLSASDAIDLALPEKAKATLHLKSSWGEIFTDLDVKLQTRRSKERLVVLSGPEQEERLVVLSGPDRESLRVQYDTAREALMRAKRAQIEAEREAKERARAAEKKAQEIEAMSEAIEKESEASRKEAEIAKEAYEKSLQELYRAQKPVLVAPPAPKVLLEDLPQPVLAPGATAPLVGDLNGGGIEVRITTMSGNIYLRKLVRK